MCFVLQNNVALLFNLCVNFVFNELTVLKASEMVTSCEENDFKCVLLHRKSTKPSCIPVHYQCNKKIDCFDGSDEDPKICRKYLHRD